PELIRGASARRLELPKRAIAAPGHAERHQTNRPQHPLRGPHRKPPSDAHGNAITTPMVAALPRIPPEASRARRAPTTGAPAHSQWRPCGWRREIQVPAARRLRSSPQTRFAILQRVSNDVELLATVEPRGDCATEPRRYFDPPSGPDQWGARSIVAAV